MYKTPMTFTMDSSLATARAVVCFCLVFVVAMLATEVIDGSPPQDEGKREAGRKFQWTGLYGAKSSAKKKLFGIVWYFPPKGSSEDHTIFDSQIMFEQSLRSPIVKISGEADRKELEGRYDVNDTRFTLVVTDWHGNLIEKFEARKKEQRLPAEKILAHVNNVRQFVKKHEKEIKKRFAKGEKEFEKKRWKKALKELVFVTRSEGFDECDRAKAFISDIETIGMDRLKEVHQTAVTDSEAALKELRKLAREFAGCSVETEANKLIDKIKNKDS